MRNSAFWKSILVFGPFMCTSLQTGDYVATARYYVRVSKWRSRDSVIWLNGQPNAHLESSVSIVNVK